MRIKSLSMSSPICSCLVLATFNDRVESCKNGKEKAEVCSATKWLYNCDLERLPNKPCLIQIQDVCGLIIVYINKLLPRNATNASWRKSFNPHILGVRFRPPTMSSLAYAVDYRLVPDGKISDLHKTNICSRCRACATTKQERQRQELISNESSS